MEKSASPDKQNDFLPLVRSQLYNNSLPIIECIKEQLEHGKQVTIFSGSNRQSAIEDAINSISSSGKLKSKLPSCCLLPLFVEVLKENLNSKDREKISFDPTLLADVEGDKKNHDQLKLSAVYFIYYLNQDHKDFTTSKQATEIKINDLLKKDYYWLANEIVKSWVTYRTKDRQFRKGMLGQNLSKCDSLPDIFKKKIKILEETEPNTDGKESKANIIEKISGRKFKSIAASHGSRRRRRVVRGRRAIFF